MKKSMLSRRNALHRELHARVRHAHQELTLSILTDGPGKESTQTKYFRSVYLRELENKAARLAEFNEEFPKYMGPRKPR